MTHNPPTSQQLDLDAIQARANAATPGPWTIEYDYCDCSEYGCSHSKFAVSFGPFASFENTTDRHHYDAEFAAHARADVEQLVAEVRRLRAANSEGVMRKNCACRGVVHADDCEVYLELLRTTEPTPEPPFESLADRWEQLAEQGDTAIGHFEGPTAVTLNAEVEERGRVYRQAAADLREALETGRIPHDLMTTAELDAARPAVRPAVETGA